MVGVGGGCCVFGFCGVVGLVGRVSLWILYSFVWSWICFC